MKNSRDLLRSIFQYDPEPLEIQSSFIALSSAVWLLYASYFFSGSCVAYKALMGYLPATLWFAVFMYMGIFKLYALKKQSVLWRSTSAMFSAVVWATISVLMVINFVPGTAISLYPIIALSEVWTYIRLGIGFSSTTALIQRDAE